MGRPVGPAGRDAAWRPGCGLFVGLAVVIGLGFSIDAWSRSEVDEREREREGVVLEVIIENPVGERVESRYVLHVDDRDVRRLGLPRAAIPDRFGTFALDLAAEIHPEDRYTACLDHEAVVTRDGVEVGAVPAGTCMSDGEGHEPAGVRVDA